jgi:hypothetical protein
MIVQWLVEIDAYNLDTAAVETLYFSNHELNTRTADTPANTPYQPRLTGQIFTLTRSIVNGDRLGGSRATAVGTVELINHDGKLDYLRNYSFDTRQVRIFRGGFKQPRASFTLQWQGVAEQLEYDDLVIRIRIKDRLYIFDKPLQNNLYPFSTVNALEGKPKPILVGTQYSLEPVCIDTTNRVYQIHDGAIQSSPFSLYDRAVSLTAGVDYTLNAAAGTVTLTANPAGVLLSDAAVYPVSGNSYIFDLIDHILRNYAAFTNSDFDASFSALNVPIPMCQYITNADKISTVLDRLMNSVGGFYYFTRLDKFTAKVITEPSDPPDIYLNIDDIISYRREQTQMPVYSVRVAHSNRPRPMTKEEIASSVSLAVVASLGVEWQYKSAVDNSVKTAYPNAVALEIFCHSDWTAVSTVQDEANRVLALYKKQRDVIQIKIARPAFSVELGQSIYVQFNRYGFDAGGFFRVIAITEYGFEDVVELTLWGSIDNAFLLTEDDLKIDFEDGSGSILLG